MAEVTEHEMYNSESLHTSASNITRKYNKELLKCLFDIHVDLVT